VSERREIRFRDRLAWGETTCGYGPAADPWCSAEATRHFMWLDDASCAMACDEHAQWIRNHSAVDADEHAMGPECGMPGAIWQFGFEEGEESWCIFPAVDDASLLTEEPVPALAAAATPQPDHDDAAVSGGGS
jgi:hypothetical protein